MYLFYAVCVVWKGLKLKEVGWSPAPFLPRTGRGFFPYFTDAKTYVFTSENH